jgi:cysteine desulfurase
VLESAKALEGDGFRVDVLPVEPSGLLDLDRLADAITDTTALVSIMAVNNEIGVIQPLGEIGRLCRRRGVLFHTDAAQAVGKIPLDVKEMAIDLMSISGHKVYGPKGIGALYVRRRPRVRLVPLFSGGGQERGLRSGTLPSPLCVGLGEACRLAGREMEAEAERLKSLSRHFMMGIAESFPGVGINGDPLRRIAGNLNVTLPGLDAERLVASLDDVALSTGSACTSASVEPSQVLLALGLDESAARASVRIGFGRFTSKEDVDYGVERIVEEVRRQRVGAPGLELRSEG